MGHSDDGCSWEADTSRLLDDERMVDERALDERMVDDLVPVSVLEESDTQMVDESVSVRIIEQASAERMVDELVPVPMTNSVRVPVSCSIDMRG